MSDNNTFHVSGNPTIKLSAPVINEIIEAISPTVTVEAIAGGHEVTITDKNGDHTFDVMDGGGAGGMDYDNLDNKPQIEGVTLTGEVSLSELGAASTEDIPDISGLYTKPDDGIPSTDMTSAVQTSLGKADSAYQVPSGGIPSTDMATAVQTSLGKADSAYQKPGSGIPGTDLASGVLTSIIDDTAGDGDTNKVWSADKSADLLSALTAVDEVLNGSAAPAIITMPNGYKSANYSNAAGTMKYKWEGDKLVLNKSNGSGEITTSNAQLTIDESLVFVVDPNEHAKLVFSYNNANGSDAEVHILGRFCRYDRLDYYDNGDIYIPTGEGTAEIDLVDFATQKGVDLTERYKYVIRGIRLEPGAESYSTAIVNIYGFATDGGREKGLVDNVADLAVKSEVIETERKYGLRLNVPAYYFDDPVSPASFDDMPYLDDAIARVPNGKSFIFLTDTHWESNAKNTFKLIQYVKNRLGINKVLFGGDCIDRGSNKYIGLNFVRNFMNIAVDALGKDFLPTIGNHDTNMGNALNDDLDDPTYRIPYDQVFKVYLSHLGDDIHTEDLSTTIASIAQSDADAAELTGWTKLHYYVDDAKDKTRYIVIYSSAYDLTLVPAYTGFATDGGGGPTTVMQYEWFARTLMSTPEGYDIIVLAHCADAENKTFPERQVLRNYFDFFVRIASAFHKKCSGYKIDISNFSEEGCPTNAFWTRETKQWDFTEAPTVGKILFMAGHIHKNVEYVSRIETDSTVYPTYERGKARNNGNPALVGIEEGVEVFDNATVDFSTGEMLTIISQCDAYNRTNDNKYSYEHGEMTQGTVTEQSFDVVTLTDSGVVCTRIGAGWDRVVPVKWLPSN